MASLSLEGCGGQEAEESAWEQGLGPVNTATRFLFPSLHRAHHHVRTLLDICAPNTPQTSTGIAPYVFVTYGVTYGDDTVKARQALRPGAGLLADSGPRSGTPYRLYAWPQLSVVPAFCQQRDDTETWRWLDDSAILLLRINLVRSSYPLGLAEVTVGRAAIALARKNNCIDLELSSNAVLEMFSPKVARQHTSATARIAVAVCNIPSVATRESMALSWALFLHL
ncbi:hypothetical protein C8R43DRAFT_1108176 [Mycena crocata]|nr:hypothetical protein C8R43DRAFT_1108176 [Mycena crocata]